MLLQRALVVFTLGPLTLLLIYLGGWFYFLPFAALLLIATYEYTRLMASLERPSALWLLVPAVLAQWLLPVEVRDMLLPGQIIEQDLVAPALLISALVALFYALWLYEKRPAEDALAALFVSVGGIVLLGWLGSHFFRLRGLPESAAQWTALAMLSTWIADSGAYVFGKTLGRHKLAPRLSPNKTIEGYVGGIAVGTLLTVLIAYFMDLPLNVALLLGLLISILAPAGDLGVSMLKRSAGVKDSGNILPGHGGALDRTDSLIWSVAFAFYLVRFAT